MNLNTGFFAAYNYRRKKPTVGYRLPLSFSKSTQNSNSSESFLPSITTNNNDGHRPYRRNDFANNHLFVAKQKLARIFLNQSTMNIQSKGELIHLFDQHEPKQKNRGINKNKRQENNSDAKSTPSLDQDGHLSIINLAMKPSLPSLNTRDPLPTISYRRTQAISLQTRAPRPSIEWINPAIKQYIQSTSNHTNDDDDHEPNTIINELIDNNPDIINCTNNLLDLSLLYVKSIILSSASQHR